jgi:hypothetical protein
VRINVVGQHADDRPGKVAIQSRDENGLKDCSLKDDKIFATRLIEIRLALLVLTISPNLNRDLLEVAQRIVFAAPELRHWEFYATRPPKEWNYKIQVKSHIGRPFELDANDWVFILLSSPGGGYQVLLSGRNLPLLTETQRWQAAADVVCNILGEQMVLDAIDEVELLHSFHPYLSQRASSIRCLPAMLANVLRCKSCGEDK